MKDFAVQKQQRAERLVLRGSRHVFLDGNELPRRWRDHALPHFCIGELGFGTGLNFLLTWQAWRELGAPRPDLHYLSIEKQPLAARDLTRDMITFFRDEQDGGLYMVAADAENFLHGAGKAMTVQSPPAML